MQKRLMIAAAKQNLLLTLTEPALLLYLSVL